MSNIVDAYPREGIVFRTKPLFQWDWGQIVRLHINDLPATYKVEFSNSTRADAVSTVQTTDEVTVPAQFLESGNLVYAWVVVVDEARTTEYALIIPVSARAKPTDQEPTPEEHSEIEQTLSALNQAVEQTAADVEAAGSYAEEAEQSAEAASSASENAIAAKDTAETKASEAGVSASNASTAAQNAGMSASQANISAQNAANSASAAETAKNAAQSAAQSVAGAMDTLEATIQADLQAEELLAPVLDTKAPAIWEDASGSIAHFEDGAEDMPLRECMVQIEPVQEGSGDPSPENVRPITGWTGVTISHSGADTTDPDEISITFPTEAGTVYGGTLDVPNGVLTVDRAVVDLGTLTWSYNRVRTRFETNGVQSAIKPSTNNNTPTNALCESYKIVSASAVQSTDFSVGVTNIGTVLVHDSRYSDADTYKAAVSGVQFVYELATPITYDLTPQEIRTLLGTNNIWADTGDIAVTYPADTKTFIEQNTPESPVQDVQVNGVSVVQDGVANVPMITSTSPGVAKVDQYSAYGINVRPDGTLQVVTASDAQIKLATSGNDRRPITPANQHKSTFYALAKAAGADMASSSNPVGTYTDAAKSAIQTMLGLSAILGTVEGATASKAYSIGQPFLHGGALYKATAAIAENDAIVPGTNCAQTTIIDLIMGV